MSDFYICYNKNDRKIIDEIIDYFDLNGIKYDLVPDSIPQSETYTSFVPEAIKNTNKFLLIASKNILDSKWINKEIEYAVNNEKEIIQFLLEDFELSDSLSFMLGGTKVVDATDDYLSKLDSIIIESKNKSNHDEPQKAKSQNSNSQNTKPQNENKQEKEPIKKVSKHSIQQVKPENGIGKYEEENGEIYEGEWLNGEKHGYGIITYENKDRIFCTYIHGKMCEFFIYVPYDGNPTFGRRVTRGSIKYPGETKLYRDMYIAGSIEKALADESNRAKFIELKDKYNNVYFGQVGFLNVHHGIGEIKYHYGNRYIGFWKDDEMHSFGRFYYNDNSAYFGFWEQDRKNGIGIQILENGNLFFGTFKDGTSQYGIKIENGTMSSSFYNFEDYSKDSSTVAYLHIKGEKFKPRKILEQGENACPYCHGYGERGFLVYDYIHTFSESKIFKTVKYCYIVPVNTFVKCDRCNKTGKLKK